MLSVLCDVLVAVYVSCMSAHCTRCRFEDQLSCAVFLSLKEDCNIATILLQLCTDPIGNKSLTYGCLRWRYSAVHAIGTGLEARLSHSRTVDANLRLQHIIGIDIVDIVLLQPVLHARTKWAMRKMLCKMQITGEIQRVELNWM